MNVVELEDVKKYYLLGEIGAMRADKSFVMNEQARFGADFSGRPLDLFRRRCYCLSTWRGPYTRLRPYASR